MTRFISIFFMISFLFSNPYSLKIINNGTVNGSPNAWTVNIYEWSTVSDNLLYSDQVMASGIVILDDILDQGVDIIVIAEASGYDVISQSLTFNASSHMEIELTGNAGDATWIENNEWNYPFLNGPSCVSGIAC